MRFPAPSIGFLSLVFLAACGSPAVEERDFSRFFGGRTGTIVVHTPETGKYIVHNIARARRRLTPFSTFKIPNSIIALETGVISGTDIPFRWSGRRYPAEAWWFPQWKGAHTLRTAIRYSVVPFYRELAHRIGRERMQVHLDRFRYGNRDISSGVDKFWLNGSLRISAMEQVDFLKRFHENRIGISHKTRDAVRSILLRESGPGYRLYAKTGGGTGFYCDAPKRALGWYVGFVEKGKGVVYFALNIDGTDFQDIVAPRPRITRAVLTHLGILPHQAKQD